MWLLWLLCALGMIALINEAKAQDTEGVFDLLMRIFGLDYNLLQNISYPWFLISLFRNYISNLILKLLKCIVEMDPPRL